METDKWLSCRDDLGRFYINLSQIEQVRVTGKHVRVLTISGQEIDVPEGAQILTTEDLENTIKFYL